MANIRIPGPLRKLVGEQETVLSDAATLADAVTQLEAQYPGIQDRILDEAGQIRRFVNIYVNGEDVRFLDNINTKLNEADEVSIVPAVAGGC